MAKGNIKVVHQKEEDHTEGNEELHRMVKYKDIKN